MKEKIFKIIASFTKEKEFDEDSALQLDLGLDSFQLMSLSLEIEKEFNISMDLEDLANILTVGDVCACVEKSLAVQNK